jgi:hypothetical protein
MEKPHSEGFCPRYCEHFCGVFQDFNGLKIGERGASLNQSNLNTLCYLQSILHLDTKVSHGARHICVP